MSKSDKEAIAATVESVRAAKHPRLADSLVAAVLSVEMEQMDNRVLARRKINELVDRHLEHSGVDQQPDH
jgi:hypothetical protein